MLELFKYTDKEIKQLLLNMTVIIDTREQKCDHIIKYFDYKKIPWVRQKLDSGDYSIKIPANESLHIPRDLDFSKEIIIERKGNLEEISKNLTSQSERSRIKKEFALSPEHKIMIIENASYKDLATGNYNTKYDKTSFLASFHSLWHEFDIPIIFMPDPSLTGMFIDKFFYYYLRNKLK